MNRKRLIITGVISIILVSILMIGTTYSIFTSKDIDENKNVYTTGILDITYTLSSENIVLEDNTPISLEDRYEIKPYRITVTNNGNVPYMFNLILNDTTAGDVIDYQYIMIEVGQLNPKSLADCTDNIIKDNIIVPANNSVNIDVRVWISDTVLNEEIGKSFYAKLSIDGLAIYDKSEEVDNSILEAITKFYGEDYTYDENTQKYISTQNSEIQFTTTISTFDYTGTVQTFTSDHTGVYKIETWGAQGGSTDYNSDGTGSLIAGGKGAYTSGNIELNRSDNLYIYVGGVGENGIAGSKSAGGFNGGGTGGSKYQGGGGGGGATDVRLISGDWNDSVSLMSRIMVSGAGSGASNYINSTSGGVGGALTGAGGKLNASSASHTLAGGGTQVSGGTAAYAGYAGSLGTGGNSNDEHGGGGGAGHYGGGGGGYCNGGVSSGAGGSSYVSGYSGAVSSGNKQKFKVEYTSSKVTAYDQYGNSILTGTSSHLIQNITRTSNFIGKSNWSGDSYFKGQIFKLKITLANGTVVLNYDFTKNSVQDFSGNGYDGTLMNGASLKYNGTEYCLSLDGVDDYLQVPTLPSSIDFASGFTVEFEAIWNGLLSWSRIMDFGNGSGSDNFAISTYTNTSKIYVVIYQGTTGTEFTTSSSVIQVNGTNYGTDKSVCETGDSDATCSYHYSGKVFQNTKMIAGSSSMPTHDGASTMTGNTGNGYAKITPIVPTITSETLSVTKGNILDVSSINCVDNGSGCEIVQMYPRDTSNLETGSHELYILVKDNYDIVYKYTKSFTVT